MQRVYHVLTTTAHGNHVEGVSPETSVQNFFRILSVRPDMVATVHIRLIDKPEQEELLARGVPYVAES